MIAPVAVRVVVGVVVGVVVLGGAIEEGVVVGLGGLVVLGEGVAVDPEGEEF